MGQIVIDQKFLELIDEYEPIRQVGTGFVFTEGPIWNPREKRLLFSDMPGDTRREWTQAGGVKVIEKPSNKGNGMTYDAALNLLVCEHSTSSVVRISPDGKREVLCSHFQGKELNSPNDICVKSDGTIYFTDPTYGRMEHFGVPRPLQQGFQGVYMLKPDHRPGDEPTLVVDKYTFNQPNGLCFSPCERWLWVNDTDQANIRMYDVDTDGQLINGRVFASGIVDSTLRGVPDGMKADIEGNVWVTGPGGIWVYDFHGMLIGKVTVPEMVANIHWGGDDFRTLFICACTSVYSVRTKVAPRNEPFMYPVEPGTVATTQSSASAPRQVGKRIDPLKTALIIQDMQNDVIIEGGAFADSGSPVHARQQNVVANSMRLADACRAAGVKVIHVWFLCPPGHPNIKQNSPLTEGLVGANALVRDTWGGAPVNGLEAKQGDIVVEKQSMSGWHNTRLESELERAGIETIINTGAWTNMSVEHTARTGADKGYEIILPEDACSTMNAEWHQASLGFGMSNVAEITSVDDVITRLG